MGPFGFAFGPVQEHFHVNVRPTTSNQGLANDMKTKSSISNNGRPGIRSRQIGVAATKITAKAVANPLGIKSILVPTDFSGPSESALTHALALARQLGARLTLLHVVEPIATTDFEAAFPLVIENEKAKKFCEGVLTQTAEKFEIEPELLEKKLVRFGRPFNEIANAARTLKVDLIIIATHGYTGLKHTFLGSTAERVVRHAPCPVLVVRTKARNAGTQLNLQPRSLL